MAASKKTNVALVAAAAEARPVGPSPYSLYGLHRIATSTPPGVIVGTRRGASPGEELVFGREGDTALKALPGLPAGALKVPDVSRDGEHVLVVAGSNKIFEVPLRGGDARLLWEGGAPLHDTYMHLMNACYAGSRHVVINSGEKLVLCRKGDGLEPVTALGYDVKIGCDTIKPLFGGRIFGCEGSTAVLFVGCAWETERLGLLGKVKLKSGFVSRAQGSEWSATLGGVSLGRIDGLSDAYAEQFGAMSSESPA
jgi:hypothetical protein